VLVALAEFALEAAGADGLASVDLVLAVRAVGATGLLNLVVELALLAQVAEGGCRSVLEFARGALDAVRDGAVAAAPAVDTVVASGEGERGLAVETNHAVGALSLGLVSLVLATRAVVAVSRALDGNGEPALLA